MQKDCQPSAKKRRRLKSGVSLTDGHTRNKGTGEVPSGLERKLDELVSLLKPAPSISPDSGYGGLAQVNVGGLTLSSRGFLVAAERLYYQHDEPSPDEAEECLATFRDCHATFFPFVYLPVTTNVVQLRQQRPLLFDAIMAVACKSTTRQNSRSTRLRQILAHEALVKSELSIDLLLALLVSVGWYA